MKKNLQKGFTLIELMVVIVILGILIALGMQNLYYANIQARESSVKSNMHSFQTVVEIYAVDYNGFYPVTVSSVVTDPSASQQRLLVEMANPFSSRKGFNEAYADESLMPKHAGLTTYIVDPSLHTYTIYGYNNLGQRLSQRGQQLILSNN